MHTGFDRWKMETSNPVSSSRPYQALWRNSCTNAIQVLSEQLKDLEEDGLISRQQFKEIPPRVEYSLTELGKSVRPLLIHIATWGQEMVLNARKINGE